MTTPLYSIEKQGSRFYVFAVRHGVKTKLQAFPTRADAVRDQRRREARAAELTARVQRMVADG